MNDELEQVDQPDIRPVHVPAPTIPALLAGMLVAGVLVFNLWTDGDKYVSLALVVVFAGVLGVDVSRFLRRGGP